MKRITLALVACNLLLGSALAAEDKIQDTYRRKTREMKEQQGKEDKEREANKKRAEEKKRKGQAK